LHFDETLPTVSAITRTSENPTKLTTLDFLVEFSEPIIGIDLADFTLVLAPKPPASILNASLASVVASGTGPDEFRFYTVTVDGISGEGDISLEVNTGGTNEFYDIPGNRYNTTFNAGEAYTVDNTPPVLDATPFAPVSGAQALPIAASPVIYFSEDVDKTTLDGKFITITKNDGTPFESFDVKNSPNITIVNNQVIIDPTVEFDQGTGYYIEVDNGAIDDIAGNPFAGFSGNAFWTFSTFSPAVVGTVDLAACIGVPINITGKFFAGFPGNVPAVTEVQFCDPAGLNCVSQTNTVANPDNIKITNDQSMSVVVPNLAPSGQIKLIKGVDIAPQLVHPSLGTNPATEALSGTGQQVLTGPSYATIEKLVGAPDYVCNDNAGNVDIATQVTIDITGGSGDYTIFYSNDNGTTTLPSFIYKTGDIKDVNPPDPGVNTYVLKSVVDNHVDLSSCVVPVDNLSGTVVVEEFTRSVVEAGGAVDLNGDGYQEADICPALNPTILMDGTLLTIAPDITGSVTAGTWSVFSGPSTGGGSFDDITINYPSDPDPTYTPTLSDAAFSGGLFLQLTSNDPTGNNPCIADNDQVQIKFVSSMSANTGGTKTMCADDGITQLTAALGGGAESVYWERDASAPVIDFGLNPYDNSWGFSEDGGSTFALTSNITNPLYKPAPEEFTSNKTVLLATPTTSGTPCGDPVPSTLLLNINANPTTQIANQDLKVCEGEKTVVFSVNDAAKESTYTWTVANAGLNPEDNKIVSGGNTNGIIINFGTVAGTNQISVTETRNSDGCAGAPVTFDVEVYANPTANFSPQINHSQLATNDYRLVLRDDVDAIIPEGLEGTTPYVRFFGSGVQKVFDETVDLNNDR
ncbi:MAG: Ig-like domain-containing protein, partial [Cyclobacteriaceae bacterium]|nr:Ig-like domain-containing protein [Cyclobacteriaceae bacterium]